MLMNASYSASVLRNFIDRMPDFAFPNRASVSYDHATVLKTEEEKSGGLHQNVPSERATLHEADANKLLAG